LPGHRADPIRQPGRPGDMPALEFMSLVFATLILIALLGAMAPDA
jgi:hypothetical protein